MNPVKVAVIGAGHLGSAHARIYSQLKSAQLVAICDILPERARTIARKSRCDAVTDFHQLIGKVDAVSIAVPTQTHFPIAKPFLEKSIHTLIEKPITPTVEEADQLIAAAEQSGAVLQVGHVERFNAALRKVFDALQEPRFIEVHRLAPFQPRGTEVGVVLDLMIHDIDLLLWLVKTSVKHSEAVGVKVLTPFEDIANARLTFSNGTVANVTSSRISKEAMRKFRIFQAAQPAATQGKPGRAGTYISIDFLAQVVEIYRLQGERITHEKIAIQREEEPLKLELASFLEAIQQKRPPPVTGAQAREALAVALQITQQIHNHQP